MDPPASQEDKKEAIMGCAVFYPMLRLDIGQHLYLDNIVVRNKHQRKGVARALMYRLREEAAKSNMKLITWQVQATITAIPPTVGVLNCLRVLQVMEDNEGALALYRGLDPPCRFGPPMIHVELKVRSHAPPHTSTHLHTHPHTSTLARVPIHNPRVGLPWLCQG